MTEIFSKFWVDGFFILKISMCKKYFIRNENARVSHLPQFDGVQNFLKNFDLDTVTLTYDRPPSGPEF